MTENFRKLSVTAANALLEEVHKRGIVVLFKFPDSGVLRLRAAGKAWGQAVLGARPATLGDSRKDQLATANFSIDGEFYFFNAKVRIQKRFVHLELQEGLHRLVRRRNNRLKVPASAALNLITKRVGDRLAFLRGPLQDISLKGCRVSFHQEQGGLKVGDTLTGDLRFGSRQPIPITAVVRHHRKLARGHYDYTVGLEFNQVGDLTRFQTWLVDLHREIYAKARGLK
ncbi:MAG: PilZ domain-containing protein [Bdellovibrionaceae bacterium]|nr:PilZ domain-containing protein [Pseudobdellovibrionaceae bacterium]MBX3032293.1 PilZ domain-containing protein [Pseudobdellovibrionaceae bacterium]